MKQINGLSFMKMGWGKYLARSVEKTISLVFFLRADKWENEK